LSIFKLKLIIILNEYYPFRYQGAGLGLVGKGSPGSIGQSCGSGAGLGSVPKVFDSHLSQPESQKSLEEKIISPPYRFDKSESFNFAIVSLFKFNFIFDFFIIIFSVCISKP
jgi:hypothetical protein